MTRRPRAPEPIGAYWSLPPEAVLARLESGPDGLSASAALDRLARFGPNRLEPARTAAGLPILLRQFRSPLVAILLFAAVVSSIVADWTDAAIISLILLGSGLLGFLQEYRASSAVERLRRQVQTRASALRDGSVTVVPSEEIVPGDVVLLAAGSLVPADCILLEARDLHVGQAVLTGESLPAEKLPGVVSPEASVVERTNCVFLGTSVRSGTGRALVVGTGARTVFGQVAGRLRARHPETEFERGLRRYGALLTEIMVFLVLLVAGANILLERPPLESFLFAIALAVGLSPELLPAIVEVTLARGAHEMAQRGVIVRRLNSIENLGSMDVLCTDKTATLTEGVLALEASCDAAGRESASVFELAHVNARFQTGLPSALDDAIVSRADRDRLDVAAWTKLDEIPYDFVRKRLTVVARRGDGTALLVTKGAFEPVLAVCDRVETAGGPKPLDDEARRALAERFAAWGGEGYRVLGVASAPVEERPRYARADEHDLVFAGFLLFLDPPKPGVEVTLRGLAELGVRIQVITGDNRYVAAHVARSVGFAQPRIVTGRELNELRDEALWRIASETDLFVEVDPHQKERILRALQRSGHVVGFLGDGINDAPALHAADVGISVDGAVDVAKEAADCVLLEHDLEVLRRGVQLGRVTFANTIKYIQITTSANFGNMISMAAASLFLPFLPLLAKQILLNNLVSDVPAIGIASDHVDPELVARPHRFELRSIRNFTLVFGLTSSVFDLLTFAALLALAGGSVTLFRTGWFVESLLTELAIALVVRTRRPFFRSRPGRLLLVLTLATIAAALLLPFLPFSGVFEFVPLPWPILLAICTIVVAYLAASEAAKRWFYRGAAT